MDSKIHFLDIWIEAENLFPASWVKASTQTTILASMDFKLMERYGSGCYFSAPYGPTKTLSGKMAERRTTNGTRVLYRAYGGVDGLRAVVEDLLKFAPRPSKALDDMELYKEEFDRMLDRPDALTVGKHFKRLVERLP